MASKRYWIQDDSRYGGGRSGSRPENRNRSESRSGSKKRNPSFNGRQQGNPDKIIQIIQKENAEIKKENAEIKKSLKEVSEQVKKLVAVSTKYVEEEIVIDIKFIEKDVENTMVIDSRAPIFLVNKAWFEKNMEVAKIDEEEVKRS